MLLPAAVAAVSGSGGGVLTRWDLFGSPVWPIKTRSFECSVLARTDYESVALPTELRRRTTAPRRTMQQRIVNRTPQTPLMTRVVGSSWTSVPCRAVPRMRFHLFEWRRPWDMETATMTTGFERRFSHGPARATDAGPTGQTAPPWVALAKRSAGVFRRVRENSEEVAGSGSPGLTRISNPAWHTTRSTMSVEGVRAFERRS